MHTHLNDELELEILDKLCLRIVKLGALLLVLVVQLFAQTASLDFLNHNRPILDAHNCYPYQGHWSDRIDRALKSGFPVSIEQDLAWDRTGGTGNGRVVLSHGPKTTGSEPLLRDYFFERVRPIVEKALADNDSRHWPLIVLHFDFQATDAPLLHAVWNLLGEYESWITTAVKTADPKQLSPLEPKPILVITEDSDEQEEVFFSQVPVGSKLRLFGSAHTNLTEQAPLEERVHLAATLTPEKLLSTPPTNYRRWWNNSWFLVEEGGQKRAGAWTRKDDRRLHALVDHAHRLGYWIRFYTLDGFQPTDGQGWDDDYNFGSRDAVLVRWKAALAAGVNFVATDQYEGLAAVMKMTSGPSQRVH
jgi:hypothetical protein